MPFQDLSSKNERDLQMMALQIDKRRPFFGWSDSFRWLEMNDYIEIRLDTARITRAGLKYLAWMCPDPRWERFK